MWSSEEESPREQLLWKPWDELQESTNLQDQGRWWAKVNLVWETGTENIEMTLLYLMLTADIAYTQWSSCCPCVALAVCQEGAVTQSWLCTVCTTARGAQW